MTRPAIWRPAAWCAVAVVGGLLGPAVRPLDPTLHPVSEALALGVLAGGAAFVALARRRVAASSFAALPRERLLARGAVLIAKSAEEEAIWRTLVLGALVHPLGAAGALAVSTVLFAAAHVGRLGRRAWWHLATGATFGLAYLATGRLIAAIAAHGTYNILVGVAPVATSGHVRFGHWSDTAPARSIAGAVRGPPPDAQTDRDPDAAVGPPPGREQGVRGGAGTRRRRPRASSRRDRRLARPERRRKVDGGRGDARAATPGRRPSRALRPRPAGRGSAPRDRSGAPGRRVPRRAFGCTRSSISFGRTSRTPLPRRRSSSGSTSPRPRIVTRPAFRAVSDGGSPSRSRSRVAHRSSSSTSRRRGWTPGRGGCS